VANSKVLGEMLRFSVRHALSTSSIDGIRRTVEQYGRGEDSHSPDGMLLASAGME